MLDSFEIITTSGVVVWSRTYAPIKPSIVNNFIADTFIEEKSGSSAIQDSQSASAVYRSLLHLSWVDKLVDNIRTIFVSLYGDQLKKPHTTIVEFGTNKFDEYFDQQLHELDKASGIDATGVPEIQLNSSLNDEPLSAPSLTYRGRNISQGGLDATSNGSSPPASPSASRPSTPSNNLLVAKAGPAARLSRRARKKNNANAPLLSSGDEGPGGRSKKAPKKGRKWDHDGMADEEDDVQLDYSAQTNPLSDSEAEATARSSALEHVDSTTWGSTTKGKFVLKDLGDEVHDILASAEASQAASSKNGSKGGLFGSGINAVSGLFRNVVGGKTLTKEDLDKAMKGMEEHLLKKNVAREAAVRLCEGVEKELLGVKTGSFESINARIQTAMEASLTKMLTPTSSMDLLREIDAVTAPPVTSLRSRRPYVISIVGVNGVGKSTNLSKICFFLLQNKYKVLIAAGDTFRSGAVEQLAVHVRNLKELTAREGGGEVDIYQKGYGKDAAAVAKTPSPTPPRRAMMWSSSTLQAAGTMTSGSCPRLRNSPNLLSLIRFSWSARPSLVPTPSLKLETSMLHLAPFGPWMASLFPSATQ
uniref:SRP54-type proteins GTP-binding domain-containing protein n=1 Tax=Bionectria ochroleuca TaxID=29856 RepID=A0A8H7NJJ2_BIOOC